MLFSVKIPLPPVITGAGSSASTTYCATYVASSAASSSSSSGRGTDVSNNSIYNCISTADSILIPIKVSSKSWLIHLKSQATSDP